MRWDFCILLLAVYNSLIIPFDQAFKPELLGSALFKALNYIIDISYVTDVILMFMTSYVTNKG